MPGGPEAQIVDVQNPAASLQDDLLVLIPVAPDLDSQKIHAARRLAERAARAFCSARIVLDPEGRVPARAQGLPYRQAAFAALRQSMVQRHLRDHRWVAWVDADVVDYPEDLFAQLAHRCGGGIAAPVVLMDGSMGDAPANRAGFGPGRFFDIAGFVEQGRWARFEPPWFDQPGPVYELDSVGACYLMPADLYRRGARHEIDPQAAAFVARKGRWTREMIALNQRGPANCYTEHYAVCRWARDHALPVRAFADLVARHAPV